MIIETYNIMHIQTCKDIIKLNANKPYGFCDVKILCRRCPFGINSPVGVTCTKTDKTIVELAKEYLELFNFYDIYGKKIRSL